MPAAIPTDGYDKSQQERNEPSNDRFDVNKLIARLIRAVEMNKNSVCVPFSELEVKQTLVDVREVFLQQPMFIQLQTPIVVCGDIHGQFTDLIRIFRHGGFPPTANYLFLGDYVDRGRNSLETIMLLLLYKIRYPEVFFLLRGNHETEEINRLYGFYDEMNRRFPGGMGARLWKSFQDVFAVMPVAALIADKVLCMHGGIPRELNLDPQDWHQLEDIKRPCEVGQEGIVCDLLWSDPGREPGYHPNTRGVSWLFGPDILQSFCQRKEIDLVVRAHQVVEDGYEFTKDPQGNTRLVTVFSAPNYCNEFNNKGALLKITLQLRCSFYVIKPVKIRQPKASVKRETTQRQLIGSNQP